MRLVSYFGMVLMLLCGCATTQTEEPDQSDLASSEVQAIEQTEAPITRVDGYSSSSAAEEFRGDVTEEPAEGRQQEPEGFSNSERIKDF